MPTESLPDVFDTTRLRLRRWSPDDASAVRAALDASDAHLRPWIPFMRHEPRSLTGTRTWLAERSARFETGEVYAYGVFKHPPPNATLVGEVLLISGADALELGYWIDVRHVRRGYGAEATSGALDAARRCGYARFELRCSPDNAGSIRLATQLGFRLRATESGSFVAPDGAAHDTQVWTL